MGSSLVFILMTLNFMFEWPCIFDLQIKARPTRCNNSDLLMISCSSTCFGRLYAHHQEVRLRYTVYGFLSCCSCCDAGESGGKMFALWLWLQVKQLPPHSAHILPPDSPASQTATTGQKTIGSETKSDLLMMGVKTPETSWRTVDYQ
jgi:hypothetical protein